MQQYQVPQFIELEDKIFGPLTLKQFLFLLAGGAVLFALYKVLPFMLFVALGIPVVGAAAALAFVKVNDRPLIITVFGAIKYYSGARLFLWKQGKKKKPAEVKKETAAQPLARPSKLTESKLKELSWSLDIHRSLKRRQERETIRL